MNKIVVNKAVQLHPTVVEAIKRHSRQEEAKGGYEAVGFVGAQQGIGVATLPMNNHAASPQEAFFVEPWEQYRAERTLTREGYKILGAYHSHPRSEALPSKSDHKMAWPDSYVFIYSVVFDELKAFKERDGILEPVALET